MVTESDQAQAEETQTATPVAPEMVSPEERYSEAESVLASLKSELTAAVAAGEPFDQLAGDYSLQVAKVNSLKVMMNSGALTEEKGQLAGVFQQIIGASRLSDLLGEDVASLNWYVVDAVAADGDKPATDSYMVVDINPRTKRSKAITQVRVGAKASGGGGRGKKFTVSDGRTLSGREVVLEFAPPDVLNNGLVANGSGKWVTKPEHIQAAITNAASQGVAISEAG